MSNMKMNKPLTPKYLAEPPKCLAERDIILNVPVYQRLFVWKANQIKNLLSDLHTSFLQSKEMRMYNIGIISVWVNTRENNAWEVVDGQQRLTFLSLFAAWVVGKQHSDSDTREEFLFDGDTRKMWRKFLFADAPKLRLRFTGRPDDEVIIKSLADDTTPPAGSFRCFAETADAFFARKVEEQHLNDFAKYVYEHCSFLVDVLPEGYGSYELNLYFEK